MGVARPFRAAAALGAASLVVCGVLIAYATRPGSDFKIYVASGEAVLQGKDIYAPPLEVVNTGPPFFSIFCVIPAVLDRISPTFARGAWTFLNVVALLLSLHLSAYVVYRRRLSMVSWPVLIPLLLTIPYVLYHLLYHQVNLIVFALTLSGMTLQEERKEPLGGILLGAACSLKVMPILFIPYLVYRGRWQAASWALASVAFFSLCPGFVLGWQPLWLDLRHWWTLLPCNPCWDAGQRNQSVLAMWDRILGHGCIPFLSAGTNTLKMSGESSVRIAWMGTAGVAALAMLVSFRGRPPRGSVAVLLEWSALFIVSTLFGPVSWKHYFVILLLPNMILYGLGIFSDDPRVRRLSLTLLWGCFLVSLSSGRLFWGSAWCLRLGMASTTTLAILAMFGGLLWLRRSVEKAGGDAGRPLAAASLEAGPGKSAGTEIVSGAIAGAPSSPSETGSGEPGGRGIRPIPP